MSDVVYLDRWKRKAREFRASQVKRFHSGNIGVIVDPSVAAAVQFVLDQIPERGELAVTVDRETGKIL